MTDYDATIARLKLDALHELQVRTNAPFAIAPGDRKNFYATTLDKVLGPFAEKLMSAMIERDQNAEDARRWQGTAESLARDLDHDQNEIGRLQDLVDAQDARILQLEQNQDRVNAYREVTEGLPEGTLGRNAVMTEILT